MKGGIKTIIEVNLERANDTSIQPDLIHPKNITNIFPQVKR